MCSLACVTPGNALSLMASAHAIELATIAVTAKEEHLPTVIETALNQPQIVHSRGATAGNSPAALNRATSHSSNASTRGDQGLEVMSPGLLFGAVAAIV